MESTNLIEPASDRPRPAIDSARDCRLDGAALLDMIGMDWSRHVLSNGLTVLLQPAETTALVHVSVAYRVGSMDEGPRQTGLAHFLEHLMFGGTRTLPGSYVTRMTEAGALDVNAMTMRDMTRYVQTIPAYMLDHVLFAEADRMGDFAGSLDPVIIERERKVVLEEKRQTEAKPMGKLFHWLSLGITPFGHPYHHPNIGYERDIAAYTMEDIRAWHAEHYGPENAVVVIAGAIDRDQTLAAVERYFGAIPPGLPAQRILAHVPPMPRQSEMRVDDRIAKPGMYLQGWSIPSFVASPRAHLAMSMAADLLGNDAASPLHRRLVDGDGLAESVSVSAIPGRGTGMFVVWTQLKARADVRIGRGVDDVIAAFGETPIDPARMEEVRVRRLTARVRDMTDLQRRATLLVEGEIFHRNAGWFREEAQLTADLGEAEIRAATHRWLGCEGFRLSVDQIVPRSAAVANPSPVPSVGDAAQLAVTAPEQQSVRLKSGAWLRLVRRSGDPTFHLRALGAGGRARERPGMEGLAQVAASIPAIGAGPDDGAALAGRMARAGLTANMTAGMAVSIANVSGLVTALPAGVALIADLILRPGFGSADHLRVADALAISAAAQARTPSDRFNTTFYRALFGGRHRIAAPMPAAPGSASRFEAAEIAPFHAAAWSPDQVNLLLAADMSLTQAAALCDEMFEGWLTSEADGMPPRLGLDPTRPGIWIVDAPGQETATISLSWRLDDADEDRFIAFNCLHDALCGGFTSRANRRLREELAWTYGVYGRAGELVPGIGPAFATVNLDVKPDKAGDALRELYRLIAAMRDDEPITSAEIEAFRRSERQRLAQLNEKSVNAVDAMQYMVQHAYADRSDWLAQRERIEALSPEMLHALAHELLPAAEAIVCVIQGERAPVRKSLERAGLGTAIVGEHGA